MISSDLKQQYSNLLTIYHPPSTTGHWPPTTGVSPLPSMSLDPNVYWPRLFHILTFNPKKEVRRAPLPLLFLDMHLFSL